MKQVLINKGQVLLPDVPSPIIEPGHILVEVAFSLISTGTEISSVESSGETILQKAINEPEKAKKVLEYFKKQGLKKTFSKIQQQKDTAKPTGYSCSGTVIQVGPGVNMFQPGDKVACAGAGMANHAEIVLVPQNLVVKVPGGCALRDAASVTLGAIAMQGVRRADPRLGEIVVVLGLGLLGLITIQIFKSAGCVVIGLDIDEHRVELAKKLGADYSFNSLKIDVLNEIRHITDDHGVDATVITAATSSDSIVQQANEITRKKGKVVIVGAVGLGLKRSPLYEKEIDLLISCSYGPGRYDPNYEDRGLDYPYAYVRWTENRNMHEYLRLLSSGKIMLSKIIEKEYPLSQVENAYNDLRSNTNKPLGVLLSYLINDDAELRKKIITRIDLNHRPVKDKIRIAVIGAGSFAKSTHLPNLKNLNSLYHIRAIVSATGSNAKITAVQFGADYASTNYQDVLDDPDVDAVLICTRHHIHSKQATLAARAGKAILLEKPMAMNLEELNQLVDVLKETKVPFMVGYNRRYSPAARKIKEIIKDRKNPMVILYRMNAGYLSKDHWTKTEEGGGRIIGEACHIFDLFQFLIDAPVVEANATSIIPKSEHITADDNQSITISYADGSIATLIYTALGSPELEKEYMELYVDGKVLILNDYRSMQVAGAKMTGWRNNQDKGHFNELLAFHKLINDNSCDLSYEGLKETSLISFI